MTLSTNTEAVSETDEACEQAASDALDFVMKKLPAINKEKGLVGVWMNAWRLAWSSALSRRSASTAGGVEVRKLEWRKLLLPVGGWAARTAFGDYMVKNTFGTDGELFGFWLEGQKRVDGWPSVEDAQNAAQADFTQRILSSLAVEAEPVAWISGEREIMLGWLRRYIDEQYSCGQVDDGMRLERLHKLLSGPTHPSSPVSAEVTEVIEPFAALVPAAFDDGYEDGDCVNLHTQHGPVAVLRVRDFRRIASINGGRDNG